MLAAAGVLSIPIVVWAAWRRAPSVDAPPRASYDVCPAAPGQPLVSLAFDSRYFSPENQSSYTEYYDRFLAYEPATGAVVARVSLGTHQQDNGRAYCLASSGDEVWIWTVADGFHVREARTGKVRRTQAQLLAGITAPVDRILPETGFHRLSVMTKDGRTTSIEIGGVPAGTRIVTDLPGGELDDRGGPREEILVDGVPLAQTDWLQPDYLVHPPTAGVEWPGPSLIVCEPVAVNQPGIQLTRIGLDGAIQWTYRPGAGAARKANECAWWASADGEHLVLLTDPNGMVGIDAATGRETFRRVQ